MNIHIKNYNGIKEINYDVVDGKINYLFGISGSGKSSIASALTKNENSKHIKVGTTIDDVVVSVDGENVIYSDYSMFDSKYMEDILIYKQNEEDVYDILFGDGGKIAQCKQDYLNEINFLLPLKEEIILKKGYIDSLIKDLKIGYVRNGKEYRSGCLIKTMAENAQLTPRFKNATIYNSAQIKWLDDGKKMGPYLEGKCPFCGKGISDKLRNKLDELAIFDAKTYEKINSKTGIFTDLNLMMPDWNKKRDVVRFNNKIKKYFNINNELDELRHYIGYLDNFDFNVGIIKTIKPSNDLKELFPEIYNAFIEFNMKIKSIKRKIGNLKTETDRLISENLKSINEKLELIGIPYKFIKKSMNENTKKATFVIKHKDQKEDSDMTESLSYGEKNIIGLLLFLLANNNKKVLIIDDPASSFDEYRRKVIFDYIYLLHKGNTILVLSHDHVFAKFATFHRHNSMKKVQTSQSTSTLEKSYALNTGSINYLENYEDCILHNIEVNDFNSLQGCILNELKNMGTEMNYRVALNLRLFYESIGKSKSNIVYGYLSAIIHKSGYDKIQEMLSYANKTESDILKVIKNDTDIVFSPLQGEYLDNISLESFSTFEKNIYCRELINTRVKKERVVKDELSNIVHLNSAYAICLNPYKFNYFSKYVYEFIQNHL